MTTADRASQETTRHFVREDIPSQSSRPALFGSFTRHEVIRRGFWSRQAEKLPALLRRDEQHLPGFAWNRRVLPMPISEGLSRRSRLADNMAPMLRGSQWPLGEPYRPISRELRPLDQACEAAEETPPSGHPAHAAVASSIPTPGQSHRSCKHPWPWPCAGRAYRPHPFARNSRRTSSGERLRSISVVVSRSWPRSRCRVGKEWDFARSLPPAPAALCYNPCHASMWG